MSPVRRRRLAGGVSARVPGGRALTRVGQRDDWLSLLELPSRTLRRRLNRRSWPASSRRPSSSSRPSNPSCLRPSLRPLAWRTEMLRPARPLPRWAPSHAVERNLETDERHRVAVYRARDLRRARPRMEGEAVLTEVDPCAQRYRAGQPHRHRRAEIDTERLRLRPLGRRGDLPIPPPRRTGTRFRRPPRRRR